jgi:hypothetical protein
VPRTAANIGARWQSREEDVAGRHESSAERSQQRLVEEIRITEPAGCGPPAPDLDRTVSGFSTEAQA